MHLSIQRRVRYIASSILGPVIVVLTTSSRAMIISAPILFCNSCMQNKLPLIRNKPQAYVKQFKTYTPSTPWAAHRGSTAVQQYPHAKENLCATFQMYQTMTICIVKIKIKIKTSCSKFKESLCTQISSCLSTLKAKLMRYHSMQCQYSCAKATYANSEHYEVYDLLKQTS